MAANSPSPSPRLGLILALAALQAVCAISGAPAAEQDDAGSSQATMPKALQVPIGIAWMEADGTLVIELFRTGDGQSAHALWRYPKTAPDYQKMLDHVGPLEPDGKKVPVAPWPN
jgi:hypothetical protein